MSVTKVTTAVLVTVMVLAASMVARSQSAKVEFLAVSIPVGFNDQSLTALLNKHAADGWDVADAVERISQDSGTTYRTAPVLILRRAAK
jgi:hypothetical protein